MKIITRYVLKEHIGPFVFALSALTSLLLLQYIARRFGDLVGRGLSWQVITEFFLLSIPFTLAMTLPMSVLVSVLFAFTRLASENEITAFKAGGVSARALMRPAIVAATLLAFFMVYFNDQLLPRANHELATLQMAILRTKPTFALKPQVINTIKESQLYLSAGYIDQGTGLMKDVTIHDVSNAVQRRTIYADSGTLSFAANRKDLLMRLYHGLMLTTPNDQQAQLTRVYYREDVLKVPDVANDFNPINADTSLKGDREMSVCELQRGYEAANGSVQRAINDSVRAMWNFRQQRGSKEPQPKDAKAEGGGGIGALYCSFIDRYFKVKKLQAAEVPRDTAQAPRQPAQAPQPAAQGPQQGAQSPQQQDEGKKALSKARADSIELANSPEMNDVKARLEDTRHRRNRYGIETQKKFSLAASCIVFVIVGAPLALRFPRGGVGLVIGASFFIFAVYYVGLIGGESLANKNLISPIWAMWIDNIIFTTIGLILMLRMGHEGVTSRGGSFVERIDATRDWFARQGRRVGFGRPLEAGRP